MTDDAHRRPIQRPFLPRNAATDDLQREQVNQLQEIATVLEGPIPVTVESLPLPEGAATATGLGDANASLSSIDNKLTEPSITIADSAVLDAFGRLRVSHPQTIFDSKLLNDAQPLVWDDSQVSGSGTSSAHSVNTASVSMSVSANTAGVRIRQSRRWVPYQPGKSQRIMMTGILGAAQAGITSRIGLHNDSNGFFFESAPSGFRVVRRTNTSGSPVDNVTVQASFNLDTLDGNGPSGITVDMSKGQIFIIDMQWLGVGRIRFGLGINGRIIYFHESNHANVISSVSISTPNLPIRYEIRNDGSGGAASIMQICTSVDSEGGREETGFSFGINRGATPMVTLNNASIYPLIAVRLNSAYKTSTIKIKSMSILCVSTGDFNWFLILNPTVVGTAFSFAQLTNASIDYDAARLNATTITGGTVIQAGCSTQTNDSSLYVTDFGDIGLGTDIAGTSDIIVLAVQRLTAAAETFYAAINFRDSQ